MRYLLIAILFASCMTPQKATDYLKKKDKLDDVCAENFPVKDTFIVGDTVIDTDTLETFEVYTDTTTLRDTVYITRTLPGKTITKTITRTDTIRRRDFAYENVLADQVRQCTDLQLQLIDKNTKLTEQVEDWKGKARKRNWIILILIGAIGAYTFLKIKKLIPF